MAEMVRKHFLLPRELAEQFEREVGARNQSQTVVALIERWLKSQQLLEVVEKHAGFASEADHPEWATPDDVNRWVRELRASAGQGDLGPVAVLPEDLRSSEEK